MFSNYVNQLCEWHNDYPLAPDKIETKKEILCNYQLMTANFNNILFSNVKKLVPNFVDKEKYVLENLQIY